MGRNVALGFSICIFITHLVLAIGGTLSFASSPSLSYGATFVILMPILDVAPMIIFSSDSHSTYFAQHEKTSVFVYLLLGIALHAPTFAMIISLQEEASKCEGDSCYIGEIVATFVLVICCASFLLVLITAMVYWCSLRDHRKAQQLRQVNNSLLPASNI